SHIHPEKPVSTVLHHQVANRYWSRTVGGEANRGQTQRNDPGSKSHRRRKQLRSLLLGLYPHRRRTWTVGGGNAAIASNKCSGFSAPLFLRKVAFPLAGIT